MAEFTQSTDDILDTIVVGSGISGLQAARMLVDEHNLKVRVFEAANYIGGRILQNSDFVKGIKIDLGAEILHGSNTELTKFARRTGQPITEIYCWAHGDGGPLEHDVDGGYGLYFVDDAEKGPRLLRYDDEDEDFVKTNEMLWELADVDENKFDDSYSLQKYLVEHGITSTAMLDMANAGYSNTLCSKSTELALKQCIRWNRHWNSESDEDGEFRFENSYGCLLDYLKKDIDVRISSPVTAVRKLRDDLFEVEIANGEKTLCRSVVVAVSPFALQQNYIKFEPELEADRVDALSALKMNPAMKVIAKFSQRCWPKHVQGMIMSGDSCKIPEMWFRDCTGRLDADEPAMGYATGFITTDFATDLMKLSDEEIVKIFIDQITHVFSHLTPRHMAARPEEEGDNLEKPEDLPKPHDVFLKGMIHKWCKEDFPYIGGGYSSAVAGKNVLYADVLSRPLHERVFFCGEYSHTQAGATAHSALETGQRAAKEVMRVLQKLL